MVVAGFGYINDIPATLPCFTINVTENPKGDSERKEQVFCIAIFVMGVSVLLFDARLLLFLLFLIKKLGYF